MICRVDSRVDSILGKVWDMLYEADTDTYGITGDYMFIAPKQYTGI